MDNSKETVSSIHNRTDVHMNSEIVTTHTRPAQVKPDKIPTWRRSRHKVPSLTKKLFAMDTCWKRKKNQFSPTEGHWRHARMISWLTVVGQHWFHGFLCTFWFILVFCLFEGNFFWPYYVLFLFFVFERKRTRSWLSQEVERIWRIWGREKKIIKVYFMNNLTKHEYNTEQLSNEPSFTPVNIDRVSKATMETLQTTH